MAKKKAVKESLVVASKVKAYVKKKGCMTSGDAVAALNDAVHGLLDCAVARTKANRRATLRAQDL